ncbi:hypothetical protein [Chryseobacterium arthrosphaerae]|uniref:hypothetical protein n=1 Tax=Chryseobacterium arthrosphaerae TaxID=651561 RepID=UPI001E469B23|nr:hypothetical protein [Chryseobacterium arthrosphaerae]UEQ78879.1 hypothetical protein J8N07_11445 [Chryseobacterium arthrosphaerae]
MKATKHIIECMVQNKIAIAVSVLFFGLISCNKDETSSENALRDFQNLICDFSKDSTEIKNVETFLVFANPSKDTIKVSLKEAHENYRNVYKKDTLKVNFETSATISIPPLDTLGVPAMSVVGKKFNNNDSILQKGFEMINIKSKKTIPNTSGYHLSKVRDFHLYKKWGEKKDTQTL